MYLILNGKSRLEIKEYNSFYNKLVGLMFKKKKINYGIRLNNCNSIHTFFMFQNIDVLITDKNNNVLKKIKDLKPNKVILPIKNGFYVYELPVNTLNKIDNFTIIK